ncbi:MAG: putative DNA binding domain-containing protein [Alphaproteobacteria bacterium]|nr:putative DNA binding domain-containing protein [Alphaproteobacteria bacterium]
MLPINITELLEQNRIESNRIEYKQGWNPTAIYHTICAFANDFENLGGGYIVVGVEEENGMAKRPVLGVPEEQLDKIQQQMVGFNNKFVPYYQPQTTVEEVDGKKVLVIRVARGQNRPYTIPIDVTAKQSSPAFYVRSGTSSIVAKGEVLDELRDMASRIPFVERGNPQIKLSDISRIHLKDYLLKVNSRLHEVDLSSDTNLMDVLEQMDLLDGPSENRMIKNVAAMMFCRHQEQFFPVTIARMAIFHEGREKNPNNFKAFPVIKGTVPEMIDKVLETLKANVIQERIIKPKDDARSIRFFNYPYQALEEAVVNAFYHRDYQVYEPVEITIEPHRISILSFSGPDRSISMQSIKEARSLRSRRYRNRRLGDFLNGLNLSEGWATGIPTIQNELEKNGSPYATIETDEGRTFFLIDIPCHPEFLKEEEVVSTLSQPVSTLYQAWMQAMDEILKNSSIDTPERVLTLCINLVSTLYQPQSQLLLEAIGYWKKSESYGLILVLLTILLESTSMKGLLDKSKQKSRVRLAQYYVKPLLELELIKMKYPDNPHHQNQQYMLTEIGKTLLERLKL